MCTRGYTPREGWPEYKRKDSVSALRGTFPPRGKSTGWARRIDYTFSPNEHDAECLVFAEYKASYTL
jgi:hypothetical protein